MDQQTNDLISKEIEGNEVCLFMKGTPDAPQCGFSMAVTNMLKLLEVNFKGVNVLEDEKLRQGIKEFSDWPTIPQLYIKKEFVGGCDLVKEMYENGELKKVEKILKDNSVHYDDIGLVTENEIIFDKEPILHIDDLIKSNKSWMEDYMDK